jgi:hypothetical protein
VRLTIAGAAAAALALLVGPSARADCQIKMNDQTSLSFNYDAARGVFSYETYWNDGSYCPDAPAVTCPPPGNFRIASPGEKSTNTNWSYMWDYRQLCYSGNNYGWFNINLWPDAPSDYGHFHLPFADPSIGSTQYSGTIGLPCSCNPHDGYGIGYGKVTNNVCQTQCPNYVTQPRSGISPHQPDQWILLWEDKNITGWEGDGALHSFQINYVQTGPGSPVQVWVWHRSTSNWWVYTIPQNSLVLINGAGITNEAFLTTPQANYTDSFGGTWRVANISVTPVN